MTDSGNKSRLLVVGCLLLGVTVVSCAGGCSYRQKKKWKDTFSFHTHNKKDESVASIKTPAMKIDDLREMAENAPKMPAAEQEKNAIELTQRIQTEEDTLVRAEIIKTMAAFSTPTSSAVLNASVRDADRDVRIASCDAWTKRGGPEATRNLAELLSSDTDLDVRMAAARALGKMKDPEAVKALAIALDDQNPALQHRAKMSIEKVTKKEFRNVNECREYVKNGSEPARATVAERLKNLF